MGDGTTTGSTVPVGVVGFGDGAAAASLAASPLMVPADDVITSTITLSGAPAGHQVQFNSSLAGSTFEPRTGTVDGAGRFVTAIRSAATGDATITAQDLTTGETFAASASVTFTSPPPPPTPEVELFGLEVTQAIQDLNNSVVLIQDKPTFVRAHVRSTSGIVNNVTAELIGRRSNGDPLPDSPLQQANAGGSINVLEGNEPDRGQLNDSFYFQLPPSWLNGTVELEFKGANRTIACAEHAPYIDYDCKATVTFEQAPTLDVRIVSIIWRGLLGWPEYRPTNEQITQVEQDLKATFPAVSNIDRAEVAVPWSEFPYTDFSLSRWADLTDLTGEDASECAGQTFLSRTYGRCRLTHLDGFHWFQSCRFWFSVLLCERWSLVRS